MTAVPRWRYLLVDVDGTMLDSRGTITPRTLEVLKRAVQSGTTLVLASGRTYHSLVRVSEGLGLPFHMISNGGAIGLTPNADRVCYTNFLEPDDWRRVVIHLREVGLSTLVFAHRHPETPLFYVESRTGDPHFQAYLGRHQERSRWVENLAQAEIPQVVEVAALGAGPAFDAASNLVMAGLNGRVQSHSMVLFLNASYGKITEFFRTGTSKWKAFLGMFPEAATQTAQVVAIGDEANDVEMIRAAGLGIAMGNATDECKTAADQITEDNDHEGLAKALEGLWP